MMKVTRTMALRLGLMAVLLCNCQLSIVNCQLIKITPERLPDLNVPRFSNNVVYCENGELTIFGGHTTGFVLEPTAEYFRDGQWHLLPMTYNHDFGLCVRLSSGKVLLGGGAVQNLGIGQSFETEIYDPYTHIFGRYGCLDRKRFHSAGIELDSGRVIIAGNWYTKDGIELYDTLSNTFTFVKEVAQQRSLPYIFRTAKDNCIILSGISEHNDTIFSPVVDRLKGEPFTVPLFETWRPLLLHNDVFSDDSFIGNAQYPSTTSHHPSPTTHDGDYAYLMPVQNKDNQVAIALVQGTDFSLLPTASPVPMESQWGKIMWGTSILVDRNVSRGYMLGHSGDCRQYILAIDYDAEPAQLTLYYTEPMPDAGVCQPVLSPEGNLYVVGGVNATGNFFTPFASVLLYRFGSQTEAATTDDPVRWPWLVLAIALLTAIVFGVLYIIRIREASPHPSPNTPLGRRTLATSGTQEHPSPNTRHPSPATEADKQLMDRISQLLEEKQLFLNSDLKMADLANELNVHPNVLSSCINNARGCSFSQFISEYRVAYAKQLLREHPELKMRQVAEESGFASDQSFFRTFKDVEGVTPRAWQASQ